MGVAIGQRNRTIPTRLIQIDELYIINNEAFSATQPIALVLLIIVSIGLLSNIVNMVVFSHLRSVSTFRFLLHLSVLDFLVLLVCASEALVQYGLQLEIRLHSTLICRLHTFLTYLLPQCSSAVLMGVSIDRALVVNNGYKLYITVKDKRQRHERVFRTEERKRTLLSLGSNVNRVDVIVGWMVGLLALANSHFLLFLDLTEVNEVGSPSEKLNRRYRWYTFVNSTLESYQMPPAYACFPNEASLYATFLTKIWIWIDLFAFIVIPFAAMAVCSVVILAKTRNSIRALGGHLNGINQIIWNKRLKKNRQLVGMLLLNNLYFLISSLPYSIAFIVFIGERNDLFIGQSFVHLILYTNNGFNFVFYAFTSQLYRQIVVRKFCCVRGQSIE